MNQVTAEELGEIVAQMNQERTQGEECLDEVLTNFLIRPWPTKITQDN